MRERTALATFEEMRLLKLSRRVVRQPANRRMSRRGRIARGQQFGDIARIVLAIAVERGDPGRLAARTPFHTAVLWPLRVT